MSKPWDNESTPIIDDIENHNELTGGNGFILSDDARKIERRMRNAERLLEDERREAVGMQFDLWCQEADAHLQAASKEDGR